MAFGRDLELEVKSCVVSENTLHRYSRCPICLLKFKDPRRLACEDVYCKSCLQGVLEGQKRNGSHLTCLVCQQPASLPSNGVDGLDTVAFVKSLVSVYGNSDIKVSCSKCNGRFCSLCIRVICSKCKKYVSAIFCEQCSVTLCTQCYEDYEWEHSTHVTMEIHDAHRILYESMQQGETVHDCSSNNVDYATNDKESNDDDACDEEQYSENDSGEEMENREAVQPRKLNTQLEPGGGLRLTYIEEVDDIVNDKISVTVDPEVALRLEPSAPRNEKRHTYFTKETNISQDCNLSSFNANRTLKGCSYMTIGFMVILAICTLAFIGIIVSAVSISSMEHVEYTIETMDTIVARVYPFWIRKVVISSSGPYNIDYMYRLSLHAISCNEIESSMSKYNLIQEGIQPTDSSALNIDVPTTINNQFTYFAASSKLEFAILVWSDITYLECSSELNLYDNYDDFINRNGPKAIYSSCVMTSKHQSENATIISYTVQNDGYIFATLSVPLGASYSINATIHQVIYDTSNVTTAYSCNISSIELHAKECSFTTIQSTIVVDYSEYCIIASVMQLSSEVDPAFVKLLVSSEPNLVQNIAYMLVICVPIAYLVVFILFWIVYSCCKCCKHRRTSFRVIQTM